TTKQIHRFDQPKEIKGTHDFWIYKSPQAPAIHYPNNSIIFSMTFIQYEKIYKQPQMRTEILYEYTDGNPGTFWDFNKYIDIPFPVKKITIANAFYDSYGNVQPRYRTLYSDLFKLGVDNGLGTIVIDNQHVKRSVEYILA